jgi:hypothetical protein
MKISIDVLKQRVAERYDPDYLVDVLGITSEELLEAFESKLIEKRDELSEVEDDDDDE